MKDEEKLEIVTARIEGKPIEWRWKNAAQNWKVMLPTDEFNFNDYVYRIAEPKPHTTPTKKVLMIVDCQYDFVNPNGSLFVHGSEDLPERIVSIMDVFDGVVFTMDAHPYNHCSFKENGGQWPVHCVAFSKGASVPDALLKASCEKPTLVLWKGNKQNAEQYGAFDTKGNCWEFCKFINKNLNGFVDVYVCGVAGDYCVSETVNGIVKNDVLSEKINKMHLLKDLCPTIDTAFDMESFAEKVGAICIYSKNILKNIFRYNPNDFRK